MAQKIRELVRAQATGFDVGTRVSSQDHLELERLLSNRGISPKQNQRKKCLLRVNAEKGVNREGHKGVREEKLPETAELWSTGHLQKELTSSSSIHTHIQHALGSEIPTGALRDTKVSTKSHSWLRVTAPPPGPVPMEVSDYAVGDPALKPALGEKTRGGGGVYLQKRKPPV